jgi:hypothetical protein
MVDEYSPLAKAYEGKFYIKNYKWQEHSAICPNSILEILIKKICPLL